MAIICRDAGLLFIMAPRTACTAVGKALLESLNGEYLPDSDILNSRGDFVVQRKHCTLNQLIENNVLSKYERSKLIAFSTVRNPYDSLVSLYHKLSVGYQPFLKDKSSWVYKVPGYVETMKFCKDHSFIEYIDRTFPDVHVLKKCIRPYHLIRKITGRKPKPENSYLQGIDVTMRFEYIQDDFDKVLALVGVDKPIKIQEINITRDRAGKSYKDYYDEKTVNKIAFYFEGILENYGYTY